MPKQMPLLSTSNSLAEARGGGSDISGDIDIPMLCMTLYLAVYDAIFLIQIILKWSPSSDFLCQTKIKIYPLLICCSLSY